jgi:soluble lytic murein transglycosylase-like protein
VFQSSRRLIIVTAIGAVLLGALLATVRAPAAELGVLERPGHQLERSIARHEAARAYRRAFQAARGADVAPRRSALAADDPGVDRLRDAAENLNRRVDRATATPEVAPPEEFGISQSTLDAIAACESGGDPAAVNPAGYYGKYQFDLGTWQRVGGSGNPAEAPEAEQDMRAAMLYASTGSNPWPVCG